ncbi:FHA domain-containing protein [Shewanella sp. YLB-07]|uniref:FHA domain-containing protein n=1 Tax=Shewanella sp. YLB-07 TaxID=2601268 RepID=UPI00128AE2E1|nr:FHA domain-containing protein [Shewanella sp. YLB-07]MPY26893.1 FHA domain-containing protein [Shewanella sp. YLB-07]
MAYLTSTTTQFQLYLKAFHQFGRLASAVDTVIDSPEISRLHAVIEWIDGAWFIRDLSKNGVWLNKQMLTVNQLHPLQLHDTICFADQQHLQFVVDNVDEPQDVLVPHAQDERQGQGASQVKPIFLQRYHFLPTESSPEIIIFYDVAAQCWLCESVDNGAVSQIEDGELLKFSDSMWQLVKGATSCEKETIALNDKPENDLCYIFNISQDEELTELTLKNRQGLIKCEVRSHHYLTALLARYKGQDQQQALPDALQGWRSISQLTKDIGLSENHVNIQIHRARKQLADKLQANGLCEPLLIERQRGRVRLAASNYQVFKGQTLEIASI